MKMDNLSSGASWLGRLPDHWRVVPSKSLFCESKEKRLSDDERLTPSQKFGVVSQSKYMELVGSNIVLADKGLDNWKHVKPDDFIISLRSFQGGLEISRITGCVTWHYIVLRARQENVSCEYYKHLFKSVRYIDALQSTCQYIRDGQDLRYSNFVQVSLPLPPLDEQKAIALFLDEKCCEIDKAISAAESSIKEYQAYKKSLIFEATTKGLDKTNELMVSDIEWVKEIPSHWSIATVGSLFHRVTEKNKELSCQVGVQFSLGTIIQKKNFDPAVNPEIAETLKGYILLEPNDVVINGLNLNFDFISQRTAMSECYGAITSAYIAIRQKANDLLPEFANYLFKAYDYKMAFHGMGGGIRKILSFSELSKMLLLVPPHGEQERIVETLNKKTQVIDKAIEEKNCIIEELKAYKKSLIYEAVTGKREIPCQ